MDEPQPLRTLASQREPRVSALLRSCDEPKVSDRCVDASNEGLAAEPLCFERVIPEAESFWLDAPGSIGCLLIHGWLGSPAELRPLAERLAARGIACYGHRLTGHGTAPEDLQDVTSVEWQLAVDAGLQHVRRRKQHVFVLGFAAGGALALYLAAAHADAAWLRGVVTLSTPVRFDDWRLRLAPGVRWIMPWAKARRVRCERDAQLITSQPVVSYERFPVVSLAHVDRLIRETRPRLRLIRAPLLAIQGQADRVVRPENAQIIYDEANSEDRATLWLEESAHFVTLGPEVEEVARVTAAFMQGRVSKPAEPPLRPIHPPVKEPHKLPELGLIRSTHRER